ncbi:RasGEF domain containing protein [Acanthamoeba castellanii str. Neff]|uniref:RasGEF domain containing protein n=1 Tax=Acanthamoeba castellanii (strain ATCC 30010 / Neff) TaxID=1257118 RepID=L8HBV5_ACACF|nr:RasGEF domain containing protein [Acanthamoeba castellanii str. Neff]ELR21886.1 RasGEF domain containing protein [Acanthamoeba castellanii str. Neff]
MGANFTSLAFLEGDRTRCKIPVWSGWSRSDLQLSYGLATGFIFNVIIFIAFFSDVDVSHSYYHHATGRPRAGGVGSEAVEWIKTNFGITREEAHWIGQTLFEWEFILSKSQSDFLDGSFNYYFQDVEGAFDNSASASPKKVGQAVAHLLSLYTQVEGDLRTPKAQADGVAGRERKDSFSGESGSAGWLGRNMRKMRAKRERSFDDRDRTVDRESSFDFSLSTSPGTERMMDLATDEGTGSGGSGRSRGFDGSKSVGHSSSGGGVSALGSAAFSVDASSSATPALWAVEEDSAEIRYMPAASPTEVPRVKAATADKLVEWLTTPKYSGKSFMTPQELLRKLLHRYIGKFTPLDPYLNDEEREQQLHLVRIKVVMVLKHWMKEHGYDFRKEGRDSGSGDIMYELETFITDILPLYMKPAAEQLRKTFEAWEADYRAKKTSQDLSPPSVSPTNAKELNIDDIDDVGILAQQMCLLEHELWRKIRPSECLNKAWSNSKQKHITSPNILTIIKRFNMMSAWVTSQVVNKVKLTDRVNAIKKFITLGKKLAECNNFNGVMQIMSGLHSSPVSRLKKSWELINKEAEWESAMRFLEELTSHDSSYKLYRSALHGSVPPCVPYLGVYLTDLTFIEDGNPNTLDDLINWNKSQMIAAVITEIRFYQTPSYTYPLVPELRDMLQELPQVEDEAVAYTLSLKVEPRDTTEAIETLLMEEAKLKQQVQQLQVRIADLEMENRRLNEQNAHLMDVVKDAHRKNSRREAGPIVGEQREQGDSSRRALRKSKEGMFFDKVIKRAAAPASNPFDKERQENASKASSPPLSPRETDAVRPTNSSAAEARPAARPLSPRANGSNATSSPPAPQQTAAAVVSNATSSPPQQASTPTTAPAPAAQLQRPQRPTAPKPLVRAISIAALNKPTSALPPPPVSPRSVAVQISDKAKSASTPDLPSLVGAAAGSELKTDLGSSSSLPSSPSSTTAGSPSPSLSVAPLRPSFAQPGIVVQPIAIPPLQARSRPRRPPRRRGRPAARDAIARRPHGLAPLHHRRPRPRPPPPSPPPAGNFLAPLRPQPGKAPAGGGPPPVPPLPSLAAVNTTTSPAALRPITPGRPID